MNQEILNSNDIRKLDSEAIQKIELQILSCIVNYSHDNNLIFYLAGGTLLGAVRHRGFIPWDDDVDIMMPRPDYECFIKEFKHPHYVVSSCEYDQDYNTPFARVWDNRTRLIFRNKKEKVIGVFVDIFPIDGYPSNKLLSKFHMCILKYYRTKINSSTRLIYKTKEKYIFIKKVFKKIWNKSGNYYSKELNKIAKRYSYDESEYVGVTTTTDHLFKERNNKMIFEYTNYMDFENLRLPAPSGYNTYLTQLYGDYIKLPPEEERKTDHNFVVYIYK